MSLCLINGKTMDCLPEHCRVYIEFSGRKAYGYSRGVTVATVSNEYAREWRDKPYIDKRGAPLFWSFDVQPNRS